MLRLVFLIVVDLVILVMGWPPFGLRAGYSLLDPARFLKVQSAYQRKSHKIRADSATIGVVSGL